MIPQQPGIGDGDDLRVRLQVGTAIDGTPQYLPQIHEGVYYLGTAQPIAEHTIFGDAPVTVTRALDASPTTPDTITLTTPIMTGTPVRVVAGVVEYLALPTLLQVEMHGVQTEYIDGAPALTIPLCYGAIAGHAVTLVGDLVNTTAGTTATGVVDATRGRIVLTDGALEDDIILVRYYVGCSFTAGGTTVQIYRGAGVAHDAATLHYRAQGKSAWRTLGDVNLHPLTSGMTDGFLYLSTTIYSTTHLSWSATPPCIYSEAWTGTLPYLESGYLPVHVRLQALDANDNPVAGEAVVWGWRCGTTSGVLSEDDHVGFSVETDSAGYASVYLTDTFLSIACADKSTPLVLEPQRENGTLLGDTLTLTPYALSAEGVTTYLHCVAVPRYTDSDGAQHYRLAAWADNQDTGRITNGNRVQFYAVVYRGDTHTLQPLLAEPTALSRTFPYTAIADDVVLAPGDAVVAGLYSSANDIAAPELLFSASPTTAEVGTPVTVRWSTPDTHNPRIVSISATPTTAPPLIASALPGSQTMVFPTAGDYSYSMTITNDGGQQTTRIVDVHVNNTPVVTPTVLLEVSTDGVNYSSSNITVDYGTQIYIRHTVTDATQLIKNNGPSWWLPTLPSGTVDHAAESSRELFFDITALGTGGGRAVANLTVHVRPVITSFTADDATVTSGGATTLRWTVLGATRVDTTVTNFGPVDLASGEFALTNITATKRYTLCVRNDDGAAGIPSLQASVLVTVQTQPTPPPEVNFTVPPNTPVDHILGDPLTLTWVSNAYAVAVTATNIPGATTPSGTATFVPDGTVATYFIRVENADIPAALDDDVVVVNYTSTDPPVVSLNASALTVNSGESVTLTWDVREMTLPGIFRIDLLASNIPGLSDPTALSGSVDSGPITQDTEFILTAYSCDSSGIAYGPSTTARVIVRVAVTPPPPTTRTEFGQLIEGCGTANFKHDSGSTKFVVTFRAERSGKIYRIGIGWNTTNPALKVGYSAGDGGTYSMSLHPDGGGSLLSISQTVIGQVTGIRPAVAIPRSDRDHTGNLLMVSFPSGSEPVVEYNKIYHLVFANTHSAPGSNYSSPNMLLSRIPRPSEQYGGWTANDITLNGQNYRCGNVFSGVFMPFTSGFDANEWNTKRSPDPARFDMNGSHMVTYIDWGGGAITGDPLYAAYQKTGSRAGTICSGGYGVGMDFTWEQGTVDITSVGAPLSRIGMPTTPCVLTLATSGGSTLCAVDLTMSGANIQQELYQLDWFHQTLPAPIRLTNGSSYRLTLTSTTPRASGYYQHYILYGDGSSSASWPVGSGNSFRWGDFGWPYHLSGGGSGRALLAQGGGWTPLPATAITFSLRGAAVGGNPAPAPDRESPTLYSNLVSIGG